MESIAARVARALVAAMEAKSPYLRGHSDRVAASAAAIADELGLGEEMVEEIRLAGWLHDVGKIGVRDEVLNKPGRLTAEEMAHVRDHVEVGVRILAPLDPNGRVLEWVMHHHERIDGSGYPAGLRGDAISIGGRILGAADALDALTSPRPFRPAMPIDEAIALLAELGPSAIDPEVLPALASLAGNGRVLVFLDT